MSAAGGSERDRPAPGRGEDGDAKAATPPALAVPDPAVSGAFAAARTSDAALILPLAGLALFTPPVATLFGAEATFLGAPLIVVYFFTAWAGLILAAWRLSRRLRAAAAPGGADPEV